MFQKQLGSGIIGSMPEDSTAKLPPNSSFVIYIIVYPINSICEQPAAIL